MSNGSMGLLIVLTLCAPALAGAKAPKEAWAVTHSVDPITGVSSCAVVAPDQFGKAKYTRLGYIYPVVENNSKLGLLIGVSSGGPYRVPTGDILWRVDSNPFRTLKAADNPATAPIVEMRAPYKTGNPDVDARAEAAIASANRMAAAMMSTSTVASGAIAYELLKEMIFGRALVYRQASIAPQYGLPSSQTNAVGQLTDAGLRPIPLDDSFRRGLQQCSITLPSE